MATALQRLEVGELVCIFPEGSITRDGRLQEFKGGVVKLQQSAQSRGLAVPVIPMALSNLWGSFFSRVENGVAMVKPLRRGWFNPVGLQVGEPVGDDPWTPQDLQQQVAALLNSGPDAAG
jgi:1-acyl-sn-glycerol-3-phosphate acyltransferase